jgi:hypothetical protein
MGGMPRPLDPLKLALLLEAAEDVSGVDRDETPSGTRTAGSREMPLPRRYIKQILGP